MSAPGQLDVGDGGEGSSPDAATRGDGEGERTREIVAAPASGLATVMGAGARAKRACPGEVHDSGGDGCMLCGPSWAS